MVGTKHGGVDAAPCFLERLSEALLQWVGDWFQDEVYKTQVGKCRFRLVNVNVLNVRMDLRDQWHCEKSDENANHIYSFCQSVFHLMMRLYVLGDISLEVAASSPMNRPLAYWRSAKIDFRPTRGMRSCFAIWLMFATSVRLQLPSSLLVPSRRKR